MTSTDITFCVSTVCPIRQECKRTKAPQHGYASMSDFYKEGQACQWYWPVKFREEP